MIEGRTKNKAVMPEDKISGGMQGRQQSLVKRKGENKGLFDKESSEVQEPGEVFETGIEDKEVNHEQVAYIPEQTSIFDLIKKETEEKTSAGAIPGQRVQNRRGGTIRSQSRVLRNTGDFASLVAPTRKYAKEIGFIAIVDKDGNILEVEKYSKGTKSRASISTDEIVGRAMNIEGAKKIYFAHNHPSDKPRPSIADKAVTQALMELAATADIDVEAIVFGDTEYAGLPTSRKDWNKLVIPQKVKPALRKLTLSLAERILIKSQDLKARPEITSPYNAKNGLKQYGNNEDGILFLDQGDRPVVFMPFIKGQSMKKITADIIKLAKSTQPPNLVTNQVSDNIHLTEYLCRLVNIQPRGDIQVLNIIKQGTSITTMGLMSKPALGTDFYSTTKPEKLTITPPTIEDLKKRSIFKG